MTKQEKNEKLDFKKLNEMIRLSRNLMKLLFPVISIGLLLLLVYLLKETRVVRIIIDIIGILSPLFIGFAFAWIFEPMIKKLEKKGVRRVLASLLTYLCFIVILIVILWIIVPMFINELGEFVKNIPTIIKYVSDFFNNIFNGITSETFDFTSVKSGILKSIETLGITLTNELPQNIINIAKSLVNGSLNFLIGIIIGFYMSLDFTSVKKHFLNLIPKRHQKDLMYLYGRLDGCLKDFVYGTLLTSLIVAVFSLIGFLIAGINAPILFAVFCGLTNIIPYFGPYIGGVPAVIVGFTVSPLTGIITLVVIVLVQFIEGNFIHPLIMSKAMDLHPVTVVVSLLVFGYFFGVVGMILATPITAIIKILYNFFAKKYEFLKFISN